MTLLHTVCRSGGRNRSGSITVRHRGGGRRRRTPSALLHRHQVLGPASSLRPLSRFRLLVALPEQRVAVIPQPVGVRSGSILSASVRPCYTPIGSSAPLLSFLPGTPLHNLEPPGGGGPLVRSPGGVAKLLRHYRHPLSPKRGYSLLRLPSGELRLLHSQQSFGTVGTVAGGRSSSNKLRKAGDSRLRGVRPTVRGIAMNPIDHPNGGGQGKTSGIGQSPWGVYSKGVKTRTRLNRFVSTTLLCAPPGNPPFSIFLPTPPQPELWSTQNWLGYG